MIDMHHYCDQKMTMLRCSILLIKINQYQTVYLLANLLSIYYQKSIVKNPGTSSLMSGRTIFVSFMLRDFLVWSCQKKIQGYITLLDPAFLSSRGTSTGANLTQVKHQH